MCARQSCSGHTWPEGWGVLSLPDPASSDGGVDWLSSWGLDGTGKEQDRSLWYVLVDV